MQKHILILVLIATVIVAGCLGPSETPPAVPAGDAAAIDTGAGDIQSGITDAEATQSELNPDISDADIDLGI